MRSFEDLEVDETIPCGRITAEREEMITFAKRYDPQPFHVDPENAGDSPFEGIVASGWYTASLCMRGLVTGVLSDIATTGAKGVDRLRWPAPVRPDDRLAVEATVADKRAESERHGLVELAIQAERLEAEDPVTVLTMVGLVLVAR